MACLGAALPSVARTELLYLACLALLYLRSWHGLLGLVYFGWFAKTAACSLAKLASLIRTMLGLCDLQRLRLARSLAKLASFVRTILGLLGLRRRRWAR